MQLGADTAEIAAHLQAGNVRPLADHSHSDNPAAGATPKRIDHLLRIQSFVGHDTALFTYCFQSQGNLLGVFDVGGHHQTSCIRLDLS
ncbi:hypothetical protein D9M71_561860 [compost metagenome]